MELPLSGARPRRGLVLEGGGAKGAYQFGVLEAFAEHGLEFDCIAGTSVGGLNGALWSTGRLAEGRQLWSTLSQDKIYPWRRIPRVLRWALAIALFAVSALAYYLQGLLAVRLAPRVRWVLGGAGATLCVISALLGSGHPLAIPIGVALGLLAISLAVLPPAYARAVVLGYAAAFGVVALLVATFYVFFALPFGPVRSVLLLVWFVLWPALCLAIGRLAIRVFRSAGQVVMAQNVLSSAPLRAEVDRIMRGAPRAVPVYVAVAEERILPDPDDLQEIPLPDEPLRLFLGSRSVEGMGTEIRIPKAFVPRYFDLSELGHDDFVSALMATAALPLGLVPAVELQGGTFVDGGIADNRPLYPLVSLAPCDEVVVVCVNPMPPEKQDGEKREWQRVQRLTDLARYDWAAALERYRGTLAVRNDPPTRCPYREPERWPRLLFVAPSAKLGNFVTGTLNFTEGYARRRMAEGRCDAEAFLAATGLAKVSGG